MRIKIQIIGRKVITIRKYWINVAGVTNISLDLELGVYGFSLLMFRWELVISVTWKKITLFYY